MDPAKYEYQSEFTKRYFSEGEARGRAGLLLKLLHLKFGALSDAVTERVHAASIAELDLWAERVLSADSLDAVLR